MPQTAKFMAVTVARMRLMQDDCTLFQVIGRDDAILWDIDLCDLRRGVYAIGVGS